MKITNIMTSELVTVELDDDLATVKHIFEHTRFHHLLVVAEGKLMGVVSDRDLLKAISPNVGTYAETQRDAATLNKRVHQIMTRKPVTLSTHALVFDAVHLFNRHRVSCIPIVDSHGRPEGIISWRDILKAIERQRQQKQPTGSN